MQVPLMQHLIRHWQHLGHRARQSVLRLAERHPAVHLALTFGLATVGVGMLVAPLLGVGALTISLVSHALSGTLLTTTVAVETVILAGLVAGGLWLRKLEFPVAEGIPLTHEQAPRLHDWVQQQRAELRAAALESIHLQDGFGVRIERRPRNGLPLTFTNQLVIGVPNLQCCSEPQLKAWVSGRLGEISLHNTGITGWLVQLRQVWMLYAQAFAGSRNPLAWLGHRVFRHYATLYAQVVAPLAARHAEQLDQLAHLMVDEEVLAESMAMEVMVPRFLDEYYWPRVYSQAAQAPEPTFQAFTNMGAIFARKLGELHAHNWVRGAFARQADGLTGPTLKQRLSAVGLAEPRYPGAPASTAADLLLGDGQRDVWAQFDLRWQAAVQEDWQQRHQQAQSDRGRLEMLQARAEQGDLHGKQAMEYAALAKRYGTEEEAKLAYERILQLNPEDARINFGVGKFLARLGDPRAVPLLEKAMEMDKHCVPAACRLITEYRMLARRDAKAAGVVPLRQVG